jgi:hypothetical protein
VSGNACWGVNSVFRAHREADRARRPKIVLHGQLADLPVQRFDIGAGRLALSGGRKELHRPFRELALPLRDLIRVDVELLGQLRQGAVAFQRGEGHLGLERGGMIPSGTFHPLLSVGDGTPSRLIEQSFHVRACPIIRG